MPPKLCFAVAAQVVAARKAAADEAAAREAAAREPVARVPPRCVFGVTGPCWCVVECPACDAAGFIQEDVHALPPAPGTQCAHGHTYRIELDA